MPAVYKHIVVVHGIGEQQLNETGINFMNEFCRALPDGVGRLKLYNLVTRDTPVLIQGRSEPAYVQYTVGGVSYYIGFSEVYWQPVTKGYLAAHDGRLPVPVFTWAHSINNRLRGDQRAGQSLSGWREAIDNAETLLGLVNSLALISRKSAQFNRILCNFLGDVEMYAETDPIHDSVNQVFRSALNDISRTRDKINADFRSKEIYIVAHSEGTVVSWKSLRLARLDPVPPAWLDEVKGFVTLGSPIDKHYLIWGKPRFETNIPMELPEEKKIRWWNFWDFSDPVGHSLDGIFARPDEAEDNQFKRVCDAGFWRYPIPGVAHVGYWKDTRIYHRIIQEVMGIPAGYSPRQMDTGSMWWGHPWLIDSGDTAAYLAGRAIELGAMVYFLSHLLAPVRGWLADAPNLQPLLDVAERWPLNAGPQLSWLNPAVWVLAPALLWKLLWDGLASGWQDKEMNLFAQFRVERLAMAVLGIPILAAALNLAVTPASRDVKDYFGWAVGLVVTVLVWKLHTVVHKGLLQLWRYGRGATAFHSPSEG